MRAIGTTALVAVTEPAVVDAAATDPARRARRHRRSLQPFPVRLGTVGTCTGPTVHPSRSSVLLFDAITVACDVARHTDGAVDPTVGVAMEALGYDRDFDELETGATEHAGTPRPAPGWWQIELDGRGRTVRVPPGTHLDLGSSAKALVADRAATRIARGVHTGVLVSIGGDVATAGAAPAGGWAIGIATDSSTPVDGVDQVVSIKAGAIASSSTSVRTWRRGGRQMHHIVDPSTGDCAAPYWRLVSASGDSCVDANAASTAAIVWGPHAPCETRRPRASRRVSCATTDRSSPSTVGRATSSAVPSRTAPNSNHELSRPLVRDAGDRPGGVGPPHRHDAARRPHRQPGRHGRAGRDSRSRTCTAGCRSSPWDSSRATS